MWIVSRFNAIWRGCKQAREVVLLLNAAIDIIIQKKDMSRFRMVMIYNGENCLQDWNLRKFSSAAVDTTAGESCGKPLLDGTPEAVIYFGRIWNPFVMNFMVIDFMDWCLVFFNDNMIMHLIYWWQSKISDFIVRSVFSFLPLFVGIICWDFSKSSTNKRGVLHCGLWSCAPAKTALVAGANGQSGCCRLLNHVNASFADVMKARKNGYLKIMIFHMIFSLKRRREGCTGCTAELCARCWAWRCAEKIS